MSEEQLNAELKHEVRVHIDQHLCESPTPTTGEALYALGKVPIGHLLFREVNGDREDQPIPDDHTAIDLTQDEHFHSAEAHERKVHIIVNGRERVWDERTISYEQLVQIANLPLPPGPNPGFTITYHDGPPHHPDGTLTAGHSVKVKEGMVFNVTPTNQS